MQSIADQTQGSWFEDTNLGTAIQINRARILDLDADGIQAVAPFQPLVVPPPTQVDYPPYNIGYTPGATAVYQPVNIANPPAVANQWRHSSRHTYENFSVVDLPSVLFRFEPFADTFIDSNTDEDIPVPALCDAATRRQIVTARGDNLRYFSFLPRYVSRDVSGALLEFWFRLDYRLEMNDIRMRIERDDAGTFPSGNALNMRRNRFRVNIGADAWGSSRSWPVRADIELLDRYTSQQICLNTTMQLDLANNRLLKPTFAPTNFNCAPPTGNQRQTYFDTGLPLDHFLTNLSQGIPSRRMVSRIALRQRLQLLTTIVQPGPASTLPTAYRNLPVGDDPSWWHDTAANATNQAHPDGRGIHEIDGLNHRAWLVREFGDPTQFVGVLARNKVRAINQ